MATKQKEKHYYILYDEGDKEMGDVYGYNAVEEQDFLKSVKENGDSNQVFIRYKVIEGEVIRIKSTLEIVKA